MLPGGNRRCRVATIGAQKMKGQARARRSNNHPQRAVLKNKERERCDQIKV